MWLDINRSCKYSVFQVGVVRHAQAYPQRFKIQNDRKNIITSIHFNNKKDNQKLKQAGKELK